MINKKQIQKLQGKVQKIKPRKELRALRRKNLRRKKIIGKGLFISSQN
jgi:hypothetical protein